MDTVRDFQGHFLSSGFMAAAKHPFHCPKHRKLNCQKSSEGCLLKYIAISLGYDCLTCTDLYSKHNYYYRNDCNTTFAWGMLSSIPIGDELWVYEISCHMIFFEPNAFIRRSLIEYKDWNQFFQSTISWELLPQWLQIWLPTLSCS